MGYRDVVLAKRPTALWMLDEPAGVFRDLSRNALDMSASGTPTRALGPFRPGLSKAARTPTTSDYISIADNNLLDPGLADWSLEVWVRKANDGNSGAIISKSNDQVNTAGYFMDFGGSGNILCRFRNTSAADTFVNATGPYHDDRPHHLVGTYDRDGLLTFFIDAKVVGTASIASQAAQNIQNGAFFSLGRRQDLSGDPLPLIASYAAAAVYIGKLLSPAEVLENYRAGLGDNLARRRRR